MRAVAHPRGRLPARVYWTRRALVLVVAGAMVFGIAQLLGGGGGSTPPEKAAVAAAHPTATRSAPIPYGPVAAPTTVARAGKHVASKTPSPTLLAEPNGPCVADQVTVTPAVKTKSAGGQITIALELTGTEPACTFAVSPKSVVVKVTSGSDRIWSTQDCPATVPSRSVTVRSAVPATVPVTWSGRRSDSDCSKSTQWARTGYYHVVAAALGSEPTDVQFRLGVPPRPVVTKTAHPKPTKHPSARSSAAG